MNKDLHAPSGFSYLALLALLVLAGCAQMPTVPKPHPLNDAIVDVNTREIISQQRLLTNFKNADVIYLGEKHDNAHHHAKQLQLIKALLADGIKPKIGFEFFDRMQTSSLMRYVDTVKHPGMVKGVSYDEAALRDDLGWTNQPDIDWQYYFKLIELAKTHQLTVFGTDLSKNLKTRLVQKSKDGLTAIEKQFVPMAPNQSNDKAYAIEQFKKAHCGFGEQNWLQRLYQTWYARNHAMADAIVAMGPSVSSPVLMIVGSGHTDYQLGLYEAVAKMAPQLNQVNFAFRELYPESLSLEDNLMAFNAGPNGQVTRFDVVWFTPEHDRVDYCADFEKHMSEK